MEILIGAFSAIAIIAGIAFAFGGALGDSMPTVLLGGLFCVLGIANLIAAVLPWGWALVLAVITVIAAWKLFWRWA